MKLNKLRQLIKEELTKVLTEEIVINRSKLADLLKDNGVYNNDNFIRTGNPSQSFLQDLIAQLEDKGISTADIYVDQPKLTDFSTKLNPSDFPSDYHSSKNTGYMGAKYTGD
jgi:hypothetical protein